MAKPPRGHYQDLGAQTGSGNREQKLLYSIEDSIALTSTAVLTLLLPCCNMTLQVQNVQYATLSYLMCNNAFMVISPCCFQYKVSRWQIVGEA